MVKWDKNSTFPIRMLWRLNETNLCQGAGRVPVLMHTLNWRKRKSLSRAQLFATPGTVLCPWNSPGKNTGVGSHSLLQGIFPTQGSNPGLLLCRQILYHLSHQGSARTLEWVAYPFSRGYFRPRNWATSLVSPAGQADFLPLSQLGSPPLIVSFHNSTRCHPMLHNEI